MKKKLGLLLTLIVSLFIYSGRVLGEQVMYIECDDDFSNFLAMITEGEGNVKFQIGYIKQNGPGSGYDRFEFILGDKDDCWINDANKISDSCSVGENGTDKLYNMNSKLCPQKMRRAWEGTDDVVFAGQLGQSIYSNTLENNEYVFLKKKDGMIFSESYNSVNGIYSHINNMNFDDEYQKKIIYGVNIKSNGHTNDECVNSDKRSELKSICDFNREYWKVAQNFDMTYVHSVCEEEANCNDYEILFDSDKNKNNLNNKIEEWVSKNVTLSDNDDYSGLLTLVNDKSYISAVDNMIKAYENNGDYNFNDGFSSRQMYEKLKLSYSYLKNIYDNPIKYKNYSGGNTQYLSDAVESALQYSMLNTIGYAKIEDYCESNKEFKCLNIPSLNSALYDDIREYLNKRNGYSDDVTILDLGNISILDEYTKKFLNAIAYFNKYSSSTDLSKDIIENELPELKKNMTDLGAQRDIFIAIDCDDLINDKLKERIGYYYNILKIIVSLALIAFGIIDFSKAVFSGDEKNMKEAQTKFIKRIVVVVILFLVPLFVKLILTIANAVWSNIYPGACGLF